MIRKLVLTGVLVTGGMIGQANAAVFDFNFDGMSSFNNASNGTVQGYMQSILPGVTVTGALGITNNNYTGDGYVVGPVSGSTVTPLTLGNTTGGVQNSLLPSAPSIDGYIVNSGLDRITIFLPEPIFGISFDYEIFPDGTCPRLNTQNRVYCGSGNSNQPDFEFLADGAQMLMMLGQVPSSPYQHSPHSGPTSDELAPQYLSGTVSYAFASGVTKLEFVDWPQRIGIDDLSLTTVPEPVTLSLVGIGLAGLGFSRRKRTR
jgi:hypothetical protein